MKISTQGLELIKGFESFVPYPYDDLKPMVRGRYREWQGERLKGTLTIGYGHTDDAGLPKIVQGMRLTEAQASEMLSDDLVKVESDVVRLVKVVISQHEFDALVSFHYNTGALARSTLLKRLNALDMRGAANEFGRWTKAKGVMLQGLVRRRQAERHLFLNGVVKFDF